MATHELMPGSDTLHGHFSCELAPVLTVESGDTIVSRTLDSGWGNIEQDDPYSKPSKVEFRDLERDPGHALCGPIAVRGAEPGMVLEVRVVGLRCGTWGWTTAGGFPHPVNERLGLLDPPEAVFRWSIDSARGMAQNQHGLTVGVRPFLGVMGMPPPEPGRHPTAPPRIWGGNLDCKELVEGTRLFLPVPVTGGLLSFGDGHGVQGDGEVSGIALECPMEHVELQILLHTGMSLPGPRAVTAEGWLTFGLHQDLHEASMLALDSMLDLMGKRLQLERGEALALASLVVDLRVTQVANGVLGVHAVLPRDAMAKG